MDYGEFFLINCFQVLIGLAIDAAIGDPEWLPHPIRLIGYSISKLENTLRKKFGSNERNLYFAGILLATLITGGFALLGLFIMFLLAQLDIMFVAPINKWFREGAASIPFFSVIIGGIICGFFFSWRSLGEEAEKIEKSLAQNKFSEARKALSMIVGRDTADLSEHEIIRATVETVAENSVDGGISPVFFAMLGGVPALIFFKAASTLDSMVGYKNETFRKIGWASAKLDDLLNFLPARLAAILIPLAALLTLQNPVRSFYIALRDHSRHPSPNSGWGESLFAGALGIQLGGPATYQGVASKKPLIGDPLKELKQSHIKQALQLLYTTEMIVLIINVIIATKFLLNFLHE
jgi:adenosylcobinamide-phosphate synthase